MLDYIKRPKVLEGYTIRMRTGCGNIYITLNRLDGQIIESFMHLGKSGNCSSSQLESLGRTISTALRSGTDISLLAKQLKGIRCQSPIWDEGEQILSCSDAIGRALEKGYAALLSEKLESSRRKAE